MQPHRNCFTVLIALFTAALFFGCVAAGAPGTECTTGEDCESGSCIDGACEERVEPLEDTFDPHDTGQPIDTTPTDVDAADTGGGADTDTGPCDGFMCPCERNAECAAGYCVGTAEGRVCTARCDETCPDPAWECRLLTDSGGDAVRLCVPPDDVLCRPCRQDIECGSLANLCVDQLDGRFCATDCSGEQTCPDEYECEQVLSFDGPAYVCVPTSGVCGGCLDLDRDGYGEGPNCLGFDCDDTSPHIYEGAPELCDTVDNDCDGEVDNGFNFDIDVRHCGGCGMTCAPPNASEFSCQTGQCVIDECAPGWEDCNGDPADGCETNVDTSPAHCGACFNTCSLPGVLHHTCEDGVCKVDTCQRGYENCNGATYDGCEIDTTADPLNCAECGNICDLSSATPACMASTCTVAGCEGTHRDCNLLPGDGCETNVSNDPFNCGFCGFECSTQNVASGSCSGGLCKIHACDSGWMDCNELPEDGCEQDVLGSVNHCGVCGSRCEAPNAIGSCSAGVCTILGCAPGWVDLDGNLANGCDYQCTFVSAVDAPDDSFIDTNCDGVDGTIGESVFVSPSGNDSANGTAPTRAVRTLSRALAVASSTGRTRVLAASGSYSGTTLTIPNGVSLHGGYATNFRTRSNAKAHFSSTDSVAIRVQNANREIVIDRFLVTTPNQNGAQWTAAMVVDSSGDNVRLFHTELSAGNGGNGTDGAPGATGAIGGTGAAGSGSTGGSGGSGGGGKGGNGRKQNDGYPGERGTNNTGSGGNGGYGGDDTGCADGDPTTGGSGLSGSQGSAGSNGSHGSGTGSLSGTAWSPVHGTGGTSGGRGGGGGGGGAGGGEDCTVFGACVYCGTGRGGGGGGGGGAGGGAGVGGKSGYASIGLIVRNSTVRTAHTTIQSARGGNGGDGGDGGGGGPGGPGGPGATTTSDTSGDGGNGGTGGPGGKGGCGGAGGGGPSVAVWGSGTATLVRGSGVTLEAGTAGSGGRSCAGDAPAGVRSQSRDITLQ